MGTRIITSFRLHPRVIRAIKQAARKLKGSDGYIVEMMTQAHFQELADFRAGEDVENESEEK